MSFSTPKILKFKIKSNRFIMREKRSGESLKLLKIQINYILKLITY